MTDIEKQRVLGKTQGLLNRRGSQFTPHDRDGVFFLVQKEMDAAQHA